MWWRDAGAVSPPNRSGCNLHAQCGAGMRDVRMDKKKQFPSAESKNLEHSSLKSGDSLPESLIQALEDALVNCRALRFDPATGMFTPSEPRGDVIGTGDSQRRTN